MKTESQSHIFSSKIHLYFQKYKNNFSFKFQDLNIFKTNMKPILKNGMKSIPKHLQVDLYSHCELPSLVLHVYNTPRYKWYQLHPGNFI